MLPVFINLLTNCDGNLNVHMWNIGRDVSTALVIRNHPACDRNYEVLKSLLSHRDRSAISSSTLGLVRSSGSPT